MCESSELESQVTASHVNTKKWNVPRFSVLRKVFNQEVTRSTKSLDKIHLNSVAHENIIIIFGSKSIGFEVAKSLSLLGANVLIIGQIKHENKRATCVIREELKKNGAKSSKASAGTVDAITLDFTNMDDVTKLILKLKHSQRYKMSDIHKVIFFHSDFPNFALSKQGFSMPFAAHILAPHLLLTTLLSNSMLNTNCRVIFTTNENYILAKGWIPDETFYEKMSTDTQQVITSKLNLMRFWYFVKFQSLFPQVNCYIVHSESMMSNMGTQESNFRIWNSLPAVSERNEISHGVYTVLTCVTEPCVVRDAKTRRNSLIRGSYYHYLNGRVILQLGDPAINLCQIEAIWKRLEVIKDWYSTSKDSETLSIGPSYPSDKYENCFNYCSTSRDSVGCSDDSF